MAGHHAISCVAAFLVEATDHGLSLRLLSRPAGDCVGGMGRSIWMKKIAAFGILGKNSMNQDVDATPPRPAGYCVVSCLEPNDGGDHSRGRVTPITTAIV